MHRWEDDLVRDMLAHEARVRAWARTVAGLAGAIVLLWLATR